MVASGSSIVGQVAPWSAMKSRAGAGGSNIRMPTIARPSAACSSSLARKSGNSSRQGTQEGPQKLTMTGRPRRSASERASPSRVVPANAGAGRPSATGLPGPDPCVNRTMATITAVAIRARTRATRIGRRRESNLRAVRGPLLDGDRPRHVRDGVDGADEDVAAHGQPIVAICCGLAAVHDLLVLEHGRLVALADVDVVDDPGRVLVVERDGERCVRRHRDRPDVEGDVLGHDREGGRWLASAARTKITAAPWRSPFGQRGAGRLSRWPVRSASSVLAYSARASTSQPTRVATRMITPAARTQPPKTSPAMRAAVPIAPRMGRNEGPGMWTPGGGPGWTTAGSVFAWVAWS